MYIYRGVIQRISLLVLQVGAVILALIVNYKINLLTLLNFYKIYIFRLATKTELKH